MAFYKAKVRENEYEISKKWEMKESYRNASEILFEKTTMRYLSLLFV